MEDTITGLHSKIEDISRFIISIVLFFLNEHLAISPILKHCPMIFLHKDAAGTSLAVSPDAVVEVGSSFFILSLLGLDCVLNHQYFTIAFSRPAS